MKTLLLALAAATAIAIAAIVGVRQQQPPAVHATARVADVLAGTDTAGYARAFEARSMRFPLDHGPHPDFRNEWWYFTGNLRASNGRRFGYQLTFFRSALAAQASPRASAWAASQAYMAHFALTDAKARRFHAFQRFSRAALGLAGAGAQPFHVWLDDWDVRSNSATAFPVILQAADSGIAVRL